MKRAAPLQLAACLAAAALGGAAGCTKTTYHPLAHQVESFQLEVDQITPANPPAETGDDADHLLPIPVGPVKFHVRVSAIGPHGELFTDFARPVSFRAIPGEVTDILDESGKSTGTMMLEVEGGVASGWIVAQKVFGDVYLRVADASPTPEYQLPPDDLPPPPDGGVDDAGIGIGIDAGTDRDDSDRTYAAGVSRAIYFKSPLLADLQRSVADATANCKVDNRLSPFTGNFLTVSAPEPVGDMIVTAVTGDGFYVTDKKAQRLPLACYSSTLGTFGHIYVFNYNFPEGLSVGDRLISLTGTVQEFSGCTQITFPSWVRAFGDPHPEDLPEPLLFDFSSESQPSAGFRLCKINPTYAPKDQMMETLCAYSNNNIEIESVESSLVKIVNAKPSNAFEDCDKNGNGNVPSFAWKVPDLPGGGPDWNNAAWGCYEDSVKDDLPDCLCNAACITGHGPHANDICSEVTTLRTYGQWVVQLEDKWKTRLSVMLRDAIPEFEPRDFALPEHQGCTLDVTGILKQVQAARPRFLIQARDERDVCCRAPAGKSCPDHLPLCP